MKIQRVTTVKDVVAEALFDEAVSPDWATRFLGEAGHHLLLAYVAEKPVGMVTGVEMTHPDKGTEMFLYELGVAEDHQRRGIGTALVKALAELARERGCYGMWVATERTNPAAMATYRAAQASTEDDHVVLTWNFD
ncbi:MAG TPA: GNAT family N-acetyltransferase [Micromonosporaceae bacterium]|nr:GNAT family N-acetyltransferase [Micromonosporaceae bacterium]